MAKKRTNAPIPTPSRPGKTPRLRRTKPTLRTPMDFLLQFLRDMPEVDLHTHVILPLLKRRNFRGVSYTHGAFEQGKDISYVVTDHYGLERLEVCQVKNSPFSGKATSGDSLAAVINQLRLCRKVEVLHPLRHVRELPQGIVLLTTFPIEDRHAANMAHELDDLKRQQVTIVPPEVLAGLVQEHLPEIFREAVPEGDAIVSRLSSILNTRQEHAAFGADPTRSLDSLFVTLTLGAHNPILRNLWGGEVNWNDPRTADFEELPRSKADCLIGMQRVMPIAFHKQPILCLMKHSATTKRMVKVKDLSYAHKADVVISDIDLAFLFRVLSRERNQLLAEAATNPGKSLNDLIYMINAAGAFLNQLDVTFGNSLFPCGISATESAPIITEQLSFAFPPSALLELQDDLCISGEPGAGKTSFVRAIARTGLSTGRRIVYFPCLRLRTGSEDILDAIIGYLQEVGECTKAAAEDYVNAAELIILDGCDEAGTFGHVLERQIRDLCVKPITLKVTGDDFEVPRDLETCFRITTTTNTTSDGVKAESGSAITVVLNDSLSRFDVARVLDKNPGCAADLGQQLASGHGRRPRLLITTRNEAELKLPRSFGRLRLEPMNDKEMSQFFARWFANSRDQAKEVLHYLKNNEHIQEVCRTPIVASIVASLAEQGADLPRTRTEVYERRFDLLLDRWAAIKQVRRSSTIPTADRKHFLAYVALWLHEKHERQISRSELELLWKRRYAKSYLNLEFDQVLEELVVCHGVLQSEGPARYSLGHLSYQEYLAAVGIRNGQKSKLLLDNITDSWWRRVLVFYAGLTHDATRIVRRLMGSHGIPDDDKLINEIRQEARLSSAEVADFLKDFSTADPEDASHDSHNDAES